jgi:hypothetical protein
MRIAPSPWWQNELRAKRVRRMPPPADHTPMRACVSPDPAHKTCGKVFPPNYGYVVVRPSPLPEIELEGFVCEDCNQIKFLGDRKRIAVYEVMGAAETENLLSTGRRPLSIGGELVDGCADLPPDPPADLPIDLKRRQQVIMELRKLGFTDREIAIGSRVIEGHSYRRCAELTGVRKTRIGVVFASFRARCSRMGIEIEDLRCKQPVPEIIVTDPSILDRRMAPAA